MQLAEELPKEENIKDITTETLLSNNKDMSHPLKIVVTGCDNISNDRVYQESN